MAVVAEFRTADGQLQTGTGIGSAQKVAFVLKQKLVTNLSYLAPASSGDVARTQASVTYAANTPLMAYRSTQPVAFLTSYKNGSNWTTKFVGPAGATSQIEVFIFDQAPNASKPGTGLNYGLELYDESGGLLFNSHQTPFKLVEWMAYPGTYPAGRDYAVMPMDHTMFITHIFGQNPPNQMWGDGIAINGREITTSSFPYQTKGVNPEWISIGAGAYPFAVIDVTGLPSAAMPNPGALSVSVSATTREVSVQSSGATNSISPASVASASGGTAPYSFAWEYVSGSTLIAAYDPVSSASFRTQSLNQPGGETRAAVWRCRVTDSQGRVGYSGEVTFRHIVVATDTTPDTITNWPSIDGVVNENDYAWSTSWHGEHYVNGINQPITLRVEVYDYSGNLDALYMDVFTWPPGASGWTHHGYFSAHVAGPDGLRKFDVPNVVNGTRVSVNPRAVTGWGRKSATCRLALWSVTGVGGQFASANQSFVVDNDNNYFPADQNPDALNWGDISASSNSDLCIGDGPTLTISGINQQIDIRATLSGSSGTGSTSDGELEIWKNGAWAAKSTNMTEGAWAQTSVVNGDTIRFRGYMGTPSGRKTRSYTVTVTNQTTGAVLDTFTVNLTVDADNNHNVPDWTPDPISIPTLSVTTNEPTANTNASFFQITGINQPITLRFSREPTTGNLYTRRLVVAVADVGAGSGGPWTYYNVGANATLDVPNVENGRWFYVHGYLETSQGIASGAWQTNITNLTTGALLASFRIEGTVDADNNYNIAPAPTVTLDRYYDSQFNFTDQGVFYTTYFLSTATVTGGQAPLSYQWEKVSGFGNWQISSPNSASTTIRYEAMTNYSNILGVFRLRVTDSLGRVSYSPELYLDASAGNVLA